MYKEYPAVEVDVKKLRHNIDEIVKRCGKRNIEVAGVVKGCNGMVDVMRQFDESSCTAIASSRLEHLEEARQAGLSGPFMAIRIPMLREVQQLVRLADISLNSELEVIEEIERECAVQGRTHRVVLMADLGDLREGFWDKEELLQTAIHIEKDLKYVELAGVGTNLGCYGSVNPTAENLGQLVDIAEAIEKAIGRQLDIISGGATTTLPLVLNGKIPARINHLRVGEGILLGKDLQDIWGIEMPWLYRDVFTLKAEVIEMKDKPSYPVGEIFVDCYGNRPEYEDRGIRRRALLALGKLDFAMTDMLTPRLLGAKIMGGSSDHLIVDVSDCEDNVCVGEIIEFDVRYAAMMYLTASRYIAVRSV